MKIVVTGSLGNIGRPLTEALVRQGHRVTVVSSQADRKGPLEALGATAAIGRLEDAEFLKATFAQADAAYCMVPLGAPDRGGPGSMRTVAANYRSAIEASRVGKVVLLSGWSANLLSEGNLETTFDGLTSTSLTILRPASFYSNFFSSLDLIRGRGMLGALLALRHYGWGFWAGQRGLLMGILGGDDRTVFVSPLDIAEAAAEELTAPPSPGVSIRYVGSDEMTCNEAAALLGRAIGKPYLKWVRISDRQMRQGLKMAGLPGPLAELLVEMESLMHSGLPLQNFHANRPRLGRVKLTDFAQEFAAAYGSR